MTWFEALVLGLLQGITEFLPVSSSGHLVIGKEFLGIEVHGASFEVVVHTATVLSILTVFRREIARLLWGCVGPFFSKKASFIRWGGRLKIPYNGDIRYVLMLLLSMLPVLVVGFFFKEQVEALFGSGLMVVGSMLIITAFLLSLAQVMTGRTASAVFSPISDTSASDTSASGMSAPDTPVSVTDSSSGSLSYKDAFIMGVSQAIAVLPGLSRSGATISTGLLLGKGRADVAKFSFLMVLIPILGEAFLDIIKGGFAPQASGIGAGVLLVGFAAAYLSGLAACRAMVALVKRAKLWGFALYCALVGVSCLLYHFVI